MTSKHYWSGTDCTVAAAATAAVAGVRVVAPSLLVNIYWCCSHVGSGLDHCGLSRQKSSNKVCYCLRRRLVVAANRYIISYHLRSAVAANTSQHLKWGSISRTGSHCTSSGSGCSCLAKRSRPR